MNPIDIRVGEAWVIERFDPLLAELFGEADELTHYLSDREVREIELHIWAAEAVRARKGKLA